MSFGANHETATADDTWNTTIEKTIIAHTPRNLPTTISLSLTGDASKVSMRPERRSPLQVSIP